MTLNNFNVLVVRFPQQLRAEAINLFVQQLTNADGTYDLTRVVSVKLTK
jgi:hypothetical protein